MCRPVLLLFILSALICIGATKTIANHSFHNANHHEESLHHGNSSHGDDSHGENHIIERFPIFKIDFARIQSPIIIGLWLFCACLGKIAFHMTPRLHTMIPESCILIVMGMVIGGIFIYSNPNPELQKSPLTADVFFIYLLPPIILDAGYFMPNRLFFDHLGTILVFAVIGTIWNSLTTGISLYALSLTGMFGPVENFPMLHILLFGSLISAVDPVAVLAVFEEIHVEEVLFILVFGESLLNDGVTVVLYHMFEGFSQIGEKNIIVEDVIRSLVSFFLVAVGGTVIGILWGFLTAFVTRFTHQVRVIEPIFIFIMSYLAYLNAELFHWSGILAITFCGITMKNYTEQNMSQKSQTTTKYAMKMLASSSETVIFLFLGVSTLHGTRHDFNIAFISFTIFFCTAYRIIGVLILSAVCNRLRIQKIDFVQKFVMSYGGLRGAVAFALAITINSHHIPLAPMFVTTTIAVVFFTVFLQGMTIKPLVEKLGVKKSNKRKLTMNERLHCRSIDYLMVGLEDITGKLGNRYIREWFKRINNTYLQPCFVRNSKAKEPKLLETLSYLKMQDAINYMHQAPSSGSDLESYSKILNQNRNVTRDWNLDIGEIEYKPGERHVSDARFHHILSDDYHPIKARRQSMYNRHAVSDEEIQTQSDFQNKMYLKTRQVAMTSIRNRKFKKINDAQRTAKKPQNGSAVKLKTDYLEESARDNLGYEDTEGLQIEFPNYNSEGDFKVRKTSSIPPSEDGDNLSTTMVENELPWKRDTDAPNVQNEFPAWLMHGDCVDHYSPTNTMLSRIGGRQETKPSLKEIFAKRHSSVNIFSQKGPDDTSPKRYPAKDDIHLHSKSKLAEIRRQSLMDFSELLESIPGTGKPNSDASKQQLNDRKTLRQSSGFDLLNTVIEEEKTPKLSKSNGIGNARSGTSSSETKKSVGSEDKSQEKSNKDEKIRKDSHGHTKVNIGAIDPDQEVNNTQL